MKLSAMANQALALHCHHPSSLEGEIGRSGGELCAAEGIVQQHHLRKRLLEVREELGGKQLIEIEVENRPASRQRRRWPVAEGTPPPQRQSVPAATVLDASGKGSGKSSGKGSGAALEHLEQRLDRLEQMPVLVAHHVGVPDEAIKRLLPPAAPPTRSRAGADRGLFICYWRIPNGLVRSWPRGLRSRMRLANPQLFAPP